MSNGLGSPLCRRTAGGQLSSRSRDDCETSGFVAARAPTGDYGIDVHIDTGFLGFSSGGLLSIVQDLFVTPLWMALVWAVHAMIVLLEWCFTIDLLDSASAGPLGAGLRRAQAMFTVPWLALSLAVASLLALYNGLIRRRVAQTLGDAALMLAMMVGGTWVIVDPVGTVGALGRWANDAGLGTLAVTTGGAPMGPQRALADSMGTVFDAVVEVPWCYLEFGDVAWCRDPSRLDPRLRAAALKIATGELLSVGCKSDPGALLACLARGSAQANALRTSARLLRSADSNGALFLALPANGPARNSINEESSLLRVICQSSEATRCRGPTAAQAEFRTNSGTWARVGGLLLIVAGVLGMLLLVGFVALRLLAAALFSLLYLLIAPAAVLAPAFGDGGRAMFRKWAGQLLGALVSKLLFAFLLGVVLTITTLLADLPAIGWWTQWLLMSAFWWGAYARRHQALDLAGGALADRQGSNGQIGRPARLGRRVREALDPPRKVVSAARAASERRPRRHDAIEHRRQRARAGRGRARAGERSQLERSQLERLLEHERRDARERSASSSETRARLSAKRAQLSRVRLAQAEAADAQDGRRGAELEHRARRIEAEVRHDLQELNASTGAVAERERGGRERAGQTRLRERARFLDAQAELPASREPRSSRAGERRDYAHLTGLIGFTRKDYDGFDPRRRRMARLQIDRELALRKELRAEASALTAAAGSSALGSRERVKGDLAFDRALAQRTRERGARTSSDSDQDWLASLRRGAPDRRAREQESTVMRDARAVARRRKRQLGSDRR